MYDDIIIGVLEALITERNQKNEDESLIETYQKLKEELELRLTEKIENQIKEDFKQCISKE